MSSILQDDEGQVLEAHSIAAGLDYPGVGPEHSYLREIGRVSYDSVTDGEALEALNLLCRTEGILPAMESAHAVAWVAGEVRAMSREELVMVCLSGRGDKDLHSISERMGGGSR